MAASSGAGLRLALVLVLVLVLVSVHLGRAGPLCASCLAFVAILAPKPKGPVLQNTKSKAVATPTDKRGFVTPKFWGLVRPHRSPHSFGRDGPSRKAGRTALDVF